MCAARLSRSLRLSVLIGQLVRGVGEMERKKKARVYTLIYVMRIKVLPL